MQALKNSDDQPLNLFKIKDTIDVATPPEEKASTCSDAVNTAATTPDEYFYGGDDDATTTGLRYKDMFGKTWEKYIHAYREPKTRLWDGDSTG